jgi:hypothetical protein
MGEMVSRRTLLRGGIAVGAALAVAGGVRLAPPEMGRLVLSATEATIVAAIALTMFPGRNFPVDGLEAGVVDAVDGIVSNLRPIHAAGFRYLLRGLEWGAVASHGARFSRLNEDSRREVLTVWMQPDPLPRRIASDSLKMVMGMAYFGNRQVREHIGYRSMCSGGLA